VRPILFLFSLVLTLTGCVAGHSHEKALRFDEAGFMRLWDVYEHCRVSADPVLMWLDAERLSRAAVATHDFPPSLPAPFNQFVSRPPLRLAADPKALAAHCALRGAQVASEDGRQDLATDLFLLVIKRHQESEYTYYVDQARAGLLQAGNRLHAASRLLPVSFAP